MKRGKSEVVLTNNYKQTSSLTKVKMKVLCRDTPAANQNIVDWHSWNFAPIRFHSGRSYKTLQHYKLIWKVKLLLWLTKTIKTHFHYLK